MKGNWPLAAWVGPVRKSKFFTKSGEVFQYCISPYVNLDHSSIMDTKTSFRFLIQDNAFETMSRILRNPDVTGPEINGQICKITTTHDVLLAIQSHYWPQYKDDQLVQVRLQGNNSREFVVLKSLMKESEDSGY